MILALIKCFLPYLFVFLVPDAIYYSEKDDEIQAPTVRVARNALIVRKINGVPLCVSTQGNTI